MGTQARIYIWHHQDRTHQTEKQMPANMDQLQNIRKQKRVGANSTIGCVLWQMFAQKSSSTQPEVTPTQCHMDCETQSHVIPTRAITGISGTKLHKAQDNSWLQHFTVDFLGLEREAFERGERVKRNSHAWGSTAEQKDSPFPGSFLQITARRKVFDTDKQLIYSGHLTTVNQLQKALRMRDSWGDKGFLDKRHSCSNQKFTLCRLGRSSPVTGHIKGFEIISTYSWGCCKATADTLGESPALQMAEAQTSQAK